MSSVAHSQRVQLGNVSTCARDNRETSLGKLKAAS